MLNDVFMNLTILGSFDPNVFPSIAAKRPTGTYSYARMRGSYICVCPPPSLCVTEFRLLFTTTATFHEPQARCRACPPQTNTARVCAHPIAAAAHPTFKVQQERNTRTEKTSNICEGWVCVCLYVCVCVRVNKGKNVRDRTFLPASRPKTSSSETPRCARRTSGSAKSRPFVVITATCQREAK